VNNSFDRLIDGMIGALRHEVLPNTSTDYARGQLFGVIFLLQNLKLRAGWSREFFRESLDALGAFRAQVDAIQGLPADAPRPENPGAADAGSGELQRLRDAGEQRVCDLIDWLAANQSRLPQPVPQAVTSAINAYMHRELQHEMRTSAKPMFTQMSLGHETTE